MAEWIECEICLEECQKDELEEHRKMCMARLMFRCTICDGDYVCKEGLWNHLDLHEIPDESKEFHYQEMRATCKLHKCAQCNDQRGYLENDFWKHVHEEHDGFFLRCTECGESFRSQKLKSDHDISNCKAREQTAKGGLEADRKFCSLVFPIQVENKASLVSCGEMSENAAVQLESLPEDLKNMPLEDTTCFESNTVDHKGTLVPDKIYGYAEIEPPMSEFSPVESNVAVDTDNNTTEMESEVLSFGNSKSKSEIIADTERILRPVFEERTGGLSDINNRFSCEFCGKIFIKLASVNMHIKRVHHIEEDLRNMHIELMSRNNHQEQKEAEKIDLKMEIKVEETTLLQHDDFGISTAIQTTITDCLDFGQYSKDQKSKHSELSSVHFSEQKSALSRERKKDVLEEFVSTSLVQNVDSRLNEMVSEVMAENNNLQPLGEHPLNGASETNCSHCGKQFSGVVHLARHIELSHQSYLCNICGITVSSHRQAQYHEMTAHREPKHKCPHCQRQFHKNYVYQKHVSVCVSRRIPCELCGLKFKNLNSLRTHKKRSHHVDKSLKKAQIDQKRCSQVQETINSEESLVDCNSRLENTQSFVKNLSSAPPDTKCSHCGKDFVNVKSLSQHISKCHEPTTCKICGMLLYGKDTARYHKKTKHTEPKHKCANCPMKFYQKTQYQAHLIICDKRKLPCKLCGQKLKTLDSMKSHMRRVHHIEGDLNEFLTDFMSGKQDRKRTKMHSIRSMKGSSETIATAEKTLPPENLLSGSSDAKCDHCGKECSDFFALALHIERNHKPHACDICGITFPSVVRARYHKMTKHLEAKHKCPHCPKTFNYEKHYRTHLSSCGSKKFSCDLCDLKFKAFEYVVRHMREVHKIKGALKKGLIDHMRCNKEPKQNSVEKNFHKMKIPAEEKTSNPFTIIDCPICGENFGDKNHVFDHVESIHQKTMCVRCGIIFASADLLNDHKLTCPQHLKHIDSQFSVEETSQLHSESSSSGLSGTVCPHCDKDCCHESLLARHNEWCHQPIVCATCNVTVRGRYRMRYHKRKYHMEPKFKCPHCSKKIHLKEHFLRHVSKHVEDSRFPCKLCGRKYKNALAVKDHMRHSHRWKEYQSVQVEETTPTEQEHQSQEEDRGKSPTITVISASQIKKRVKPKFSCNKCHQTFHEIRAFETHANDHVKKKKNLQRQIADAHTPSEISCDKCDLKFTTRHKLVYHVKKIHTEASFKCPECGKLYSIQYAFRRHMAVHLKAKQKKMSESTEISEKRIDDDLENNQKLSS